MKNITKIIISTFLVILLANGALGFADWGSNANITNTTNITDIPQDTGTISQIDLNNTTDSDQGIIMVQHLIELDAVQLKAENKLLIRETLIFRNMGTENFFGDLRTWVPDGSENIVVARSEMMTSGRNVPINNFSRDGNIISWKEYIEQNSSLPFMYALEYTVQQKAGGPEIFSKKLAVPTLISYPYKEKPGLAAVIVKINKSQTSTVRFTDENGNNIATTEVVDGGIYRFSSPEFKEINVEISQSLLPASGNQSYAIYIVIAILIILVLLYPYIKKKLQSDKTHEDTSKENETEATEINEEEEIEAEADSSVSSGKYEGKKANELLDIKNQLLSRIKDLEKKYESGELLDEDYEDKRKSYQDDLKEIEEKLKKMG